MKATKRFSHGLQASGAFTWAKGFTRATRQDFFNPESSVWALQQIPPRALTFNFTYTTPKASFLPNYANLIARDWQIGGFAVYQSGAYLIPPNSPTLNFLPSEDVRVGSKRDRLPDLPCHKDCRLRTKRWAHWGSCSVWSDRRTRELRASMRRDDQVSVGEEARIRTCNIAGTLPSRVGTSILRRCCSQASLES